MKFQSESDVIRAPTGQMKNKTFKLNGLFPAGSRSQSKAITVSHHIVQFEIDTQFPEPKKNTPK